VASVRIVYFAPSSSNSTRWVVSVTPSRLLVEPGEVLQDAFHVGQHLPALGHHARVLLPETRDRLGGASHGRLELPQALEQRFLAHVPLTSTPKRRRTASTIWSYASLTSASVSVRSSARKPSRQATLRAPASTPGPV